MFDSSSCAVICHVVGITYQTIEHRLLAEMLGDPLGKNCSKSDLSSVRFCIFPRVGANGLPLLSVHPDTQVKVWMNKYGWTENEEGQIFIFSQEESVKPKNIVEKIDFESEFSSPVYVFICCN